MTGVIRTLLILILVYYGIRLLFRLLAPIMLRYFTKKMHDRMQNGPYTREEPKKKEGEVTIEYSQPLKNDKGEKSGGDYVDFEEIEK